MKNALLINAIEERNCSKLKRHQREIHNYEEGLTKHDKDTIQLIRNKKMKNKLTHTNQLKLMQYEEFKYLFQIT